MHILDGRILYKFMVLVHKLDHPSLYHTPSFGVFKSLEEQNQKRHIKQQWLEVILFIIRIDLNAIVIFVAY